MGDFYLLEPLQTYPTNDAKSWLGRIVQDFRRPVSAYTPQTVPSPYEFEYHADPNFTDITKVIDSIKSTSVQLSILDLFGISGEFYRSHKHTFESRKVERWRVHHDAKVLERVLLEADVAVDLEKWDFGFFRPLYLIVGFLVTDSVSYRSEEKSKTSLGGQIDPAQIAGLASGVPLPVTSSIQPKNEVGRDEVLKAEVSGSRIIAIEYRSFRKRLIQRPGKSVNLKNHGPHGERTFNKDADGSAMDPERQDSVDVVVSFDTEEFTEIVEDEGDIEMCFRLDGAARSPLDSV